MAISLEKAQEVAEAILRHVNRGKATVVLADLAKIDAGPSYNETVRQIINAVSATKPGSVS